jgi:hypothetical protein
MQSETVLWAERGKQLELGQRVAAINRLVILILYAKPLPRLA